VLPPRVTNVPTAPLSLATLGRAYDLSSGWWPGMPVAPAHPPLQVMTYRTPHGMRADKAFPYADGANTQNYAFISEVISTTTHAGTHIDALCHVTDGELDTWFGGHSARDHLGDFGAQREDASQLSPYVGRGVMLDIPRTLGVEQLAAGMPIGPAEMAAACHQQGLTLQAGDAVLLRTGFMRQWPDPGAMSQHEQPGLSLTGARWLLDHQPALIGADNTSLEVSPSGVPGEPQPVHRYLIRQHGIPIVEWVYLEDLAADEANEFLFIALPLTIRGATGSLLRPLAIT
jgi:kynurenine formamidase